MSKSDDYILITGSHNLDAGLSDSDKKIQEEDDDASLRALESHGITILGEIERPVSDKPRDQFSRELMDEGGIEIVSGDEDEEPSFL